MFRQVLPTAPDRTIGIILLSEGASPAAKEVEHKHHQRDEEQEMNQPAGDVKCKSTPPEYQKDNCDDK